MNKLKIYLFLLLFNSYYAFGQTSVYDYIKLGNYSVGYQDTVIFDTNYNYEAFGYKGLKPQFVKVWYPITSGTKSLTNITFNDFFDEYKKNELSDVHREIKKHYQEAIIRDCLSEDLITGDSINFEPYSYSDIIDSLSKIKTKSFYLRADKKLQYPIIVYHHGAQSFSFENYLMAEYFASRGYVFISSNFHLPYENKEFGLKPFDKIIINEEEESLKNLIKFAKSLSNNSSVFFIGHSWGAQMGFRTLDNNASMNGFVSLETTIEFKQDVKKIEELWPEVYHKVAIEKTRYTFPILMCASTGEEKPFIFFQNLTAPRITFATTKKEFEHNAYTSVFYLRYFINPSIIQNDKEELLDRLKLYVKHLELINIFFDDILKKENKMGTDIKIIK